MGSSGSGTSGSSGTGSTAGACIELAPDDGGFFRDGQGGFYSFVTPPVPGTDLSDVDFAAYNPDGGSYTATGTFQFGTGANATVATCTECGFVVSGYADGGAGPAFFASGGSVTINSIDQARGAINAALADVTFGEIAQDPSTGAYVPVDGGSCVHIASAAIDVAPVPAGWSCLADYYGDGTCDCGCGVQDPDCADTNISTCAYCDCQTGDTCDSSDTTQCVAQPPPPAGWTCDPSLYANGSCDCGCGVQDSDCTGTTDPTECVQCDCASGTCDTSNTTQCDAQPPPPAGWTCDASFYGDGFVCDCGCGALDPDCADATASSCGDCSSCDPTGSASCTDVVDPTDNSQCLGGSSGSTGSGSTSGGSTGSSGSTGSTGSTGTDASAEIGAVRAAIQGGTLSSPMSIDGAIVSYIKFDDSDLVTDGGVEGAGFFIQNDATGPALFIETDAISVPANLQLGDELNISVSSGTVQNGITFVTGATITRVGTLATVPTAQNLSSDSRFTSAIPSGDWDIESELVTISGTIDGGFGAGGNGFEAAPFETSGTAGASVLKLRLPTDVVNGLGLFQGCGVTASNVPMWRFNSTPELTAWTTDDVSGVSCPAVQVSVAPAGTADVSSSIVLTFNAPMATSSVTAQSAPGPCTGSVQVSTDNFNTCIGFAAGPYFASGESTVATLVPSPELSYSTPYTVKVVSGRSAGVIAQDGDALAADVTSTFTTSAPTGPTCTDVASGALVISQVYGGGGNSGSTYTNDFIELHNRSNASIAVDGLSVQYASGSGTSWQVTPLAGTVPAGGYFLVQEAKGSGGTTSLPTPDVTGTISMGASSGKVALVSGTTALAVACPPVIDLIDYGSGNCPEGSLAPSGSAVNSLSRAGSGCTDTDDNATDFSAGPAAPRNSATTAEVCTCGTGSDTANGTSGETNYCVIQSPTTAQTLSLSGQNGLPANLTVYGQFYEQNVTPSGGTNSNIKAQVGYGPTTSNPEDQSGWLWSDAQFNPACQSCGNNDEYFTTITPGATGSYGYGFRVSLDQGATWTYCDASNSDVPTFQVTQLPSLTVTP